MVKNLPANAGDEGLIHGLGRSPGGGNGKIFPPVFLLEKIPWTEEPESLQGCKKESDVTKRLNNTFLAELRGAVARAAYRCWSIHYHLI